MVLLKIEEIEFPNKDGKVLPQKKTIKIDNEDKEVEVLPFIEQEFDEVMKKINSKDEKEGTLFVNKTIIEKIVNPKITEENIKFVKPLAKAELLKAVLIATGINKEQIDETKITENVKKE